MSLPKSTMIAGTMNWGKWGRNFNKTAIQQVIETFITEKITTFDHADIYGGYTTEETFGEAFLKTGIKDAKQIVVSDADIVTNAVTKTTGPLPMGELPFEAFQCANKTFLLNAIDYLVNDNGLFESRNKVVVLRLLDKQKVVDQEKIWQLITTVGPVVLLLLIGLLVSFWRKKKYL